MLTVVTFKWRPAAGQPKFSAEHVNVLAAMVRRHYPHPHRFVCVTDDPAGLGPGVEPMELWRDHGQMANPHGPAYPSCYRRLKLFDPEMRHLLGDRLVSLDLDMVITGDLTPLWHRREDFVIVAGFNPTTHYNGSMILMTAGARPHVWSEFDPASSPRLATAKRQFGSDQGWISYRLGDREATWTKADGVYSFRYSVPRLGPKLPSNTRLVCFNGKGNNPWDSDPQRFGWVRENWR